MAWCHGEPQAAPTCAEDGCGTSAPIVRARGDRVVADFIGPDAGGRKRMSFPGTPVIKHGKKIPGIYVFGTVRYDMYRCRILQYLYSAKGIPIRQARRISYVPWTNRKGELRPISNVGQLSSLLPSLREKIVPRRGSTREADLREPPGFTFSPSPMDFSEPTLFAMADVPTDMTFQDNSKVKEQRAYRVGLSYACKRCGLPKKGHKCLFSTGASVDGEAGQEGASQKKVKSNPSKDAKKPNPDDASDEMKAPSSKKRVRKEDGKGASEEDVNAGPASQASKHDHVAAEDAVLLAELLEFNQTQRPPSLLTPEDGDASRCGVPGGMISAISAPPPSLASASNMFSPSQFMTNLGTPTPVTITPGHRFQTGLSPGITSGHGFHSGLSPGTLNALASGPPSPGLWMLAEESARKQRAVAAAAPSETPSRSPERI